MLDKVRPVGMWLQHRVFGCSVTLAQVLLECSVSQSMWIWIGFSKIERRKRSVER